MPQSLQVFRCDGVPTVTASVIDDMSIAETFNAANIGIRWNVERYGLQRLEFTIKARSREDLYDRLNNHLGHRVGVIGSAVYKPITGFVTGVEPLGGYRLRYVAKGPYVWLLRDLVNTIYTTAGQISANLQTLLTNNCEATGANYDNIASNTTTLGGYQNRYPEGSYPGDIITAWLNKSDSSSNIYDFWLVDNPLDGLAVQEWIPHYAARSSTASINWQVDRNDLSRLTQSRDINALRTNVTVYYGTIDGTHDGPSKGNSFAGTHDGGNNSADLIDTGENFEEKGVKRGDAVHNTDDNSSAVVASLSTDTNPNDTIVFQGDGLTGGTDNDFDTGDNYTIETHTRIGEHDGGNNSDELIDSSEDFTVTNIVMSGDKVENLTDGSSAVVERVDEAAVDTIYFVSGLSGGTDDDFDTNDKYVITLQKAVFDSTADFRADGVKPGDRVANITDVSRGIVVQVLPTMLILDGLSGGVDNRFDASDAYSVEMQDPQFSSNDSITADYWSVDVAEFESSMTETQANQYRTALLNTDPTQRQSFVVTAPTIRDGSGVRWPLWEVIAQGGGYIRINDLYPASALFGTSLDTLSTFFITALDYDYKSNALRVQVDNPDARLDARLRRAQILDSEMINADPLPPGVDEFNPFN